MLAVVAAESQMLYTREFSMLYLSPSSQERSIHTAKIAARSPMSVFSAYQNVFFGLLVSKLSSYNVDSWIPTQELDS